MLRSWTDVKTASNALGWDGFPKFYKCLGEGIGWDVFPNISKKWRNSTIFQLIVFPSGVTEPLLLKYVQFTHNVFPCGLIEMWEVRAAAVLSLASIMIAQLSTGSSHRPLGHLTTR